MLSAKAMIAKLRGCNQQRVRVFFGFAMTWFDECRLRRLRNSVYPALVSVSIGATLSLERAMTNSCTEHVTHMRRAKPTSA